jgi:pyrophosphatase PpaX
MIKAILFDIDGVLFDSLDANIFFFQSLFNKAGYTKPLTKNDYKPMNHLSMLSIIKQWTSVSDEEANKIWEWGRSREVPYPDHLVALPKNAKKTILALHKKYKLGIVTSRVKEGIYISDLANLEKYFDVAIGFQDTTDHKPHPEPLLLACKKLSIKPKETIYIGDSASDGIAGKAAGMKVICYGTTPFENADAYTKSFKELPNIIESLK